MALSDKINELKVVENDDQVEATRKREAKKHADGWERGIQWDGEKGSVYSGPVDGEPTGEDWLKILREFGLDPDIYAIHPDSKVNVRAWDANVGRDPDTGEVCIERMRYYKADVILKSRHVWVTEKELTAMMKRPRPPKARKETMEPHAFVVNLADWQIGKGGEGAEESGVVGTVDRIKASLVGAVKRVKELRKLGVNIETIVIMGLGDLVEACSGHYPSQAFTTELNERQQFRLANRLFRDFVIEMSYLAPKVIVGSVSGNHGETRQNGKAITDPGDNKDAAIIDNVSMALSMGEFDNVKFVAEDRKMWITLDLYGTIVGWTHGHLARGGATSAAKQYNWIQKQAANKTDIGEAEILVTGHYHSFCIAEHSQGLMWLQAPAMDAGSEWWKNSTGEHSTPGTLTFLVGPTCRPKADYIKIV